MTTQQKLQIVSERIRKDIPRLMELREGCLVQNNDNAKIGVFLGYTHDNKNAVLKEYKTGEIFIDYEKYFWINEHDIFAYSIIGHEIMLNDVLEWLSGIDYYETELDNGELIIKDLVSSNGPSSYDPSSGAKKCYTWDLSTPYLKDRSEELINFLYELQK